MKNVPIALFSVLIFLVSCSKTDPNNSGSGTGSGTGSGGSTTTGTIGSLVMNISWSTPNPTIGCPTTAFVDVAFSGPGSNLAGPIVPLQLE